MKTILHELAHSPFCIPIAQMLRAAVKMESVRYGRARVWLPDSAGHTGNNRFAECRN